MQNTSAEWNYERTEKLMFAALSPPSIQSNASTVCWLPFSLAFYIQARYYFIPSHRACVHTHTAAAQCSCAQRGLANSLAGLSTYTIAHATVAIERAILSLYCGCAVLSSCSYQSDSVYTLIPTTMYCYYRIIPVAARERKALLRARSHTERALTRSKAFGLSVAC